MASHIVLSYRRQPGFPKRDVILTIRANVRGHLDLRPESIEVPTESAEKIIREVEIDSQLVADFEIELLEPSAPWITTEILRPDHVRQDGASTPARFRVVIDPAAIPHEPYGWTTRPQSIRIQTSADEERSVDLPIRLVAPKEGASR